MRTLPFDHEVATAATDLSIAPREVRDHSPARGLPARNGLRAPWTRLGPTNRSRAIALHTQPAAPVQRCPPERPYAAERAYPSPGPARPRQTSRLHSQTSLRIATQSISNQLPAPSYKNQRLCARPHICWFARSQS
jgi:hypothetical protein